MTSHLTLAVLLMSTALAAAGDGQTAAVPPGPPRGPTLERIGHAAVVIESSTGTRILIDPYHGDHWTGLRFPTDLRVDAAAVTHPHYDHDGVAQLAPGIPVHVSPGSVQVGEVRLTGIEGEHSGPARFRARGAEPWNVVWLVEADGVRVLHIGDNGSPSPAVLAAVGRADVLLVPPFLSRAEAMAAWAAVRPRAIVPIHTRHPVLADAAFPLPSADAWAKDGPVERHVSHRWRIDLATGAGTAPAVHLIPDAPGLVGWSPSLTAAWAAARAGQAAQTTGDAAAALAAYDRAAALEPRVLQFALQVATLLHAAGRSDDALARLDAAVARDAMPDRETLIRSRALLGRLLDRAGRTAEAARHYRLAAAESRTYAADAVAEARAWLAAHGG